MPQLGALEGFETGIEISTRLLLELGMNNKFITYADFVEDDLKPTDTNDNISGHPPDTEFSSN